MKKGKYLLEYIIEELETIQGMLLPRDGQKKNVVTLLNNWKKHIVAIDELIEELRDKNEKT